MCVHNSLNGRFSSLLIESTVTLVIAEHFCSPGQHVSFGCPESDQLLGILAEVTFLAIQYWDREKDRLSSVWWCLITLSTDLFLIFFSFFFI